MSARGKRKGGSGKRKGSAFERYVCKALSRWVSGGDQEDLFWRSAMSGGRATVALKKGEVVRQAGDITAVTPEGHALTDHWYVECKFYRRIGLEGWAVTNTGKLKKWWRVCRKQAKQHNRMPMLIVKQNGWPVLVITDQDTLEAHVSPEMTLHRRCVDVTLFEQLINCSFKLFHEDIE